ncbi:hypothetical protein OBBRIDRAFT_820155 [Obba rivulosa]|uniref:CCR4-NOT transcription complex subunit 11 n=1 Tax=Obba rivulosa TaxID=1052685 RepID=A0A8E2DIZ1_9APHY|nr:hypothetical protein OBBRIDRAFT_820155 [Obba rivulosa]
MQTATFFAPPLATKQPPADPVRASVRHLLSRAYSLPCSTAAQAFTQLVQPTSRFQYALDVLMPLLETQVEIAQRILVSYLLYSLYAPHPIAINPFKSVLYATFVKERNLATNVANSGGVSENEQLVWVLWKILKGDGNDIGPFSPSTLARSPLPPKLRAAYLALEEEVPASERLTKFDPFGDGDSNDTNDTDMTRIDESSADITVVAEPVKTVLEETETTELDQETEKLSEAMTLLLAARHRVLTLSEQRVLIPMVPRLTSPPIITSVDLPSLIANNPTLAHPLLVALLTQSAWSGGQGPVPYLEVLKRLPPTLPSFDVLGRLLRDPTTLTDVTTGGRTTVADLVRMEILGWFVHESIRWLEKAEEEEREGVISDDRFAQGVQNLCRFYNSLIKLSIVDPASDADSAEMAHFTLLNSRFEEANALYRVLAMGKF